MAEKDTARGWQYVGEAGRAGQKVGSARAGERTGSRLDSGGQAGARRGPAGLESDERSRPSWGRALASQDERRRRRPLTGGEIAVFVVAGIVALAFLTLLSRQAWTLAVPAALVILVLGWLELRRR